MRNMRVKRPNPSKIANDPLGPAILNTSTAVGCGAGFVLAFSGIGLAFAVGCIMLVAHYLPLLLGW